MIATERKPILAGATPTASADPPFWSESPAALLARLATSTADGLSAEEAGRRLAANGTPLAAAHPTRDALGLLLGQFKSPVIVILIAAAILSAFLKDAVDAVIILAIVVISGLLGFFQEHSAASAVQKLLQLVEVTASCLRGGAVVAVRTAEVVAGDIVVLAAGDIIPADCRLLESRVLFVNEAALTGETFPVEKMPATLPAETGLSARTNSLFMGTDVVSGSARAVVVHTGRSTEFGKVSATLTRRPPETEFERGIRHFGYLLMEVTLLLVLVIFAVNVFFHRAVLESFEFSLALAVGMTPQLLPAIISINLAHGAKRMAAKKVIVKRLSSIENFGSMDVLCTDKTGTLTVGKVQVHAASDPTGAPSDFVLLCATLNAAFQTGYANPIDQAVLAFSKADLSKYTKLDEEPYDFVRKRLSILAAQPDPAAPHLMVTKGALANILEVCTTVSDPSGTPVPLDPARASIQAQYESFSAQGFRTLGVAVRNSGAETAIDRDDEAGMTFVGFLVLFDPLQPGIVDALQGLRDLGVGLKLITGDNALVAGTVSRQAGIANPTVMTGSELRELSQDALRVRASSTDVFAEVEPSQKERIIRSLMAAGHVVGYMGDGINDASALHAADVGISVATAVDVAKEAADIVLLEKDLTVLASGVQEGRITFANTLKYVFMATSANFGNMFSMAGASLILPFLPMLPKQILLSNLMTDFPAMTIATDSADQEMLNRPRRWDMGFIRRFMIVFGLLNSTCDYITFGVLLLVMHATAAQFRTGWFVENVSTAAMIVLIIRTRQRFYRSRPSRPLLIASSAAVGLVIVMPYLPFTNLLGFVPLPLVFLPVLGSILVFYVVIVEIAKYFFYRNEDRRIPNRRLVTQ